MIGLGVGVDYALFILTRHRDIYHERGGHNLRGSDQFYVKELAIEQAMDSSGRAVVFAGITVIIALMGMFALGFEFMNGLAVAMSIGVFVVLLASITILPALLAFFGTRVGGCAPCPAPRGGRAKCESASGALRRLCPASRADHGGLRRCWCLALAVPALESAWLQRLEQRQPVTDHAAGLRPAGRRASAPASTRRSSSRCACRRSTTAYPANQMAKALETTEGIASVDKPRLSPGRTAASIIAYPTTSPQSAETTTW